MRPPGRVQMKVDRAKFLLLTGTIGAATALAMTAASGCTVVQKSGTDGGGPAEDPPAQDAAVDTTDASATDGGGTDGGSCLGGGTADAGAVDCSGLATNGCDLTCERWAPTFKPAIAKAMADCLLKLPSCEGGTDAVTACADAALAKACDDPTAKSYCTPIATACSGSDSGDHVTQAGCEALAKGLSEEGRTTFLSCVTEGTPGYCTADSSYCLGAMK